MSRFLIYFFTVVGVGTLSCASRPELVSRTQLHMGTWVSVEVPKDQMEVSGKIFQKISHIESLLSTYKNDSEISKKNRREKVSFSSETLEVLRQAKRVAVETHGAFDPTLGRLSQRSNDFKKGKSQWPSEKERAKAKKHTGYQNLSVSSSGASWPPSVHVDLGGIGKGYAVDKVKSLFSESHLKWGSVALSGDIFCVHACQFSIRSPWDKSKVLGTGTLKQKGLSLSTSGRDIQKGPNGIHHLIDGKTGWPAKGIFSITLIGKGSNAKLDAWATGLFIMGPKKAKRALGYLPWAWVMVDDKNQIWISKNFYSLVGDWNWSSEVRDKKITIADPRKEI